MTKGILVVIEGVNGAGKTTIINELVYCFNTLKVPFSVYKFPNRNGIHGRRIDKYLKGEIKIDSKYDILDMFAADRASVMEDIKKDVKDGKVVICDRYVYSAIAYQIPLSLTDSKKLRLYCNVIGHFDKTMPLPDIVYIIEGDHLAKRGIAHREVFHYKGSLSAQMSFMLQRVVAQYPNQFMVVKNKTGDLGTVVNYIFNDIRIRQ